MNRIEAYVQEVLDHVPRAFPERRQIELDLRSHLLDRVDAGDSEEAAIERMGPAEQVARDYLADIPLEYASRVRRLGAFMVDMGLGLLLVLSVGLLLAPWWIGTEVAFEPPIVVFVFIAAIGVVALVLGLLYFPALEAVYGQTLGKRLLGICVATESGTRVGWGKAFLRRLPFYFEFFWLDALFALFTSKRQRAFDLVARTVVVRCSRRAAAATGTARVEP